MELPGTSSFSSKVKIKYGQQNQQKQVVTSRINTTTHKPLISNHTVRREKRRDFLESTPRKRKLGDLREVVTKKFKEETSFENEINVLSRKIRLNNRFDKINTHHNKQDFRLLTGSTSKYKDLRLGITHPGYSENINSDIGCPGGSGHKKYKLSFTILDNIAKTDSEHILHKVNEYKEGLMEMIHSPMERLDDFVLIFKILSNVSQSPFEELKSKFILDVCHSAFINNLRNYLIDLPYTENKSQNSLYWKNESEFWKNFITFCVAIFETSPVTAVKKCRALIENISITCLEYLSQRHDFVLPDEYLLRLDTLRNKLISYADGNKLENKDTKGNDVSMKPPENFRELSVVPTREDLLDSQPFLRPNIVDGGYSDVEHYLDVQFRLLREDCFGPIREGIRQYLADPHKRKYDHVRIYRNVKFIGPYISNLKVGNLVQIDIESNHYLKRMNWARSKRFLFGSLVIFTQDHNFNNVIVASILDRDKTMLSLGKLPISIINSSYGVDIRDGDMYTMIESEVYYEAYYHVLKALQAASFPRHLAMQQYIVKVSTEAALPSYLTHDTEYTIKTKLGSKIKFNVSQPESWPKKEDLEFNESQYAAYKLALTHEFAVIQGPPGTGKTYIGLHVAKTLLQNIKANNTCLMLVICYTNHALDQFLAEISKITKNIVRIGNQSRNEAIAQFNLFNLRRYHNNNNELFIKSKANLKKHIDDFQEALLLLDILNYGVINCKAFEEEIPQFGFLCNYYRQLPSIKNPLMHWLFENNTDYYTDFHKCLSDSEALNMDDIDDNEYNNMRTEYNIVLDDDKDKTTYMTEVRRRYTSFSLFDAQSALRHMIVDYKNSRKGFTEKYCAEKEIQVLNAKIKQFMDMTKYRSEEINLHIDETTNFARILPHHRWCLYFMWIKNKVNEVTSQVKSFQMSVAPVIVAHEEARMLVDMELLKKSGTKVLGMTTSGAARMRKLLQAVSPKIVIVEEAAEVLEQHIITSLTKSCQHLILIGDHQQLRPSAAYMKLAKQYNIEVSLFERMITNGIHSRRLKVQHRMRPEIAALISPHIYPDLENHPSVENFDDVLGMEKNVFFFTHEHLEEANPYDNTSKANHKEADMTLALANYLIQQGYTSEDVTILAAYSGQMFYMKKERNNYVHLSDVKITVVDNYQGEESKIILLSLVRNNPENNIGFLGIKNRICVALSRAKQGLYIFGNINMLKIKSELWRQITTTLEINGSLGTVLKLKCRVHPDQITLVETLEDYSKVPEGGCLRKCNYQYSCGHLCLLYCHGYDREHIQTKCTEQCERVLCELKHVCPLKCRETCGPCKVLVKKDLPCGHHMNVYCYREPDDPRNICLEEIEVILPVCGHKLKKQCSMDINKAKCKEKCKLRLECGHACALRCHIAFSNHDNYMCTKNCTKAKKGCKAGLDSNLGEHQCNKKCFECCDDCNVQVAKERSYCKHVERVACCVNIDETLCKKKCVRIMDCGHQCKKSCYEECGDCKIMMTKVIPECNHKIKLECKTKVRREMCTVVCPRKLPCGHACAARCGEPCDAARCAQLTPPEGAVRASCGHDVQLPCAVYAAFIAGNIESKELLKYCKKPCNEELACKHLCRGTCSQCHQGRLHVPCKQTCNQLNICGHQCQEPCNQICPPCNMPCEVQCPHSRCGRKCGLPCVPCKERCRRRCPHGACSRRCFEPCSREPCSEACARVLACGHRCRGVCGEPCPDVCRVCRPQQFPTDFLGDQYGDDEKFILLEDCGHVLLLEDMDILMMGDRENIQIRQCPFCRKPIINTNRYKDLVNNMFKNEINPIKERIYGKTNEINKKKIELRKKISTIYKKCSKAHPDLSTAFRQFITFVNSQEKTFLLQIEMLIIYCDIIDMLTDRWLTFEQNQTNVLKEEMGANMAIILNTLKIDFQSKIPIKVSEQQQKDIRNELKRLNSIVSFAKLLEVSKHVTNDPNVQIQTEITKKAVFSLSVFDEDRAVESLKQLQKSIKSYDIIVTKLERAMIVKAVGLKAGHWYKCPNGHFYCIGECGGANQISKCADCGVSIGGTSHALLTDNAHAPEIDGSAFAAYSEEANNMANFIIDN